MHVQDHWNRRTARLCPAWFRAVLQAASISVKLAKLDVQGLD